MWRCSHIWTKYRYDWTTYLMIQNWTRHALHISLRESLYHFCFWFFFFANLLFHSFLLLFAEKCPWNIKDVLLVTKTWMRQMILIQQFFLNFLRNFFSRVFSKFSKILLAKNIENFLWLLFCQEFFEQINVKLRNMEKKKKKWTFLPNSFIEHHK